MKLIKTTPKFELKVYRDFIREAAPYVSLILGQKVKADDADKLSDAELSKIALKIDERVTDLNHRPDKPK
ncbi:MAG TPA: hypothetical protein VM432_05260 [Bdellovibrionales bacterium]|jgi:hypothetical protein|nr:hypothetical protein [Bdellovibrionales bacterium]